jgi:cytochrome c peroxidase
MGNMLKIMEKPARFAGSLAWYKALSVTLGVTFAIRAAPIRDSAAAAAERSAPMAKFTRPPGEPFPAENPCSPEKAELGRRLFFDPLMSASGTISCATCHHPRLAWSDGLPQPSAPTSNTSPS